MKAIPRFYFKEWRVAAGLTLQEVGDALGYSKGTIGRIENGERAWTSDFLIDFCRLVGCQSIGDPLVRLPWHPRPPPPGYVSVRKRRLG